MTALRPALLLGLLFATPAGAAFELSEYYSPNASLKPGYYACRSGLDFDDFTWEFDLAEGGKHKLRGIEGSGLFEIAPDGSLAIPSGPFAHDTTAATYGMNTTRLSDGNTVIILRYDFGEVVTDDYCAWVR